MYSKSNFCIQNVIIFALFKHNRCVTIASKKYNHKGSKNHIAKVLNFVGIVITKSNAKQMPSFT